MVIHKYLWSLIISVYVIGMPSISSAYIASLPLYEDMTGKADVVIIATSIDQRELREISYLPGVTSGGKPVPAIQVETTFKPIVFFKGQVVSDRLVVVHFRPSKTPAAIKTPGPKLINFHPHDGVQYLMFLKRRQDGKYGAVNETEPGWCIEKLAHAAKAVE